MRRFAFLTMAALLLPPGPGDAASVAGSDGQNALGYVSCARAGLAMGRCPAELLRKDGQNVTLRVLLPGGEVRYVYFTDGVATSTNATAAMNTETRGKTLLIYIDPGEVIELPAAAVANQ